MRLGFDDERQAPGGGLTTAWVAKAPRAGDGALGPPLPGPAYGTGLVA